MEFVFGTRFALELSFSISDFRFFHLYNNVHVLFTVTLLSDRIFCNRDNGLVPTLPLFARLNFTYDI